MKYQYVIWDLDGTLLDTLEDLAAAQMQHWRNLECRCERWTRYGNSLETVCED
jgi:phosphoglycolate phosphatase-like HAD superfamily hydrolase